MTPTHAGWIVRSPRRRGGRAFDHLNAASRRAGRIHALNRHGTDYLALCGVAVLARYGNESDLDGPTTGHIRPAEELAVTCERCRKMMETTRAH